VQFIVMTSIGLHLLHIQNNHSITISLSTYQK